MKNKKIKQMSRKIKVNNVRVTRLTLDPPTIYWKAKGLKGFLKTKHERIKLPKGAKPINIFRRGDYIHIRYNILK